MGWISHRGYLAAKELLAAADNKRSPDHSLLNEQALENIRMFEDRVRDGRTAFLPVTRFTSVCVAEHCRNRFIAQAKLRQLSQLEPAICGTCGVALIPDALFIALKGTS